MESENRMREKRDGGKRKKRKDGGREKSKRDKVRAMEGERERQWRRRRRWGLKMMIHPDPSECCHVPPSR